jgi:hypothetical protein
MHTSAEPHAADSRYTEAIDYTSASSCGILCMRGGHDSASMSGRPYLFPFSASPFE